MLRSARDLPPTPEPAGSPVNTISRSIEQLCQGVRSLISRQRHTRGARSTFHLLHRIVADVSVLCAAVQSPYPGVSWFCIQMCITILLELVGLLLLFVPLMGLDAQRAKVSFFLLTAFLEASIYDAFR